MDTLAAMSNYIPVDFAPAEREQVRATIGLSGASGGGKSYTGLALLSGLIAPIPDPTMERKIAVIDTDGGKSRIYAKGRPFFFSVADLRDFSPEAFIKQIKRAEEMGFECLMVDNICDEWEWILAEVDQMKKRTKDAREIWAEMTPRHNAFIRCLTKTNMHVVATVLSKPAYEMVDDERRPGKKKMQRVGLQPIQREGVERLFDIFGDMTDGVMNVTKTRCSPLFRQMVTTPGAELAQTIKDWLVDGVNQEGFERAVLALTGATGAFRDAQEKTVTDMLLELAPAAALAKDEFDSTKARIYRAFQAASLDRATGDKLFAAFKAEVTAIVVKQKAGVDAKIRPEGAPPPAVAAA